MSCEHDPAESVKASACDHPAEHLLEALCPRCDEVVDAVCPECGGNVEASGADEGGAGLSSLSRAEFYRRMVLLIHNSRNSKFTCGCYLIATGDGFADGISMTEFGRAWGVRKATVSKQCRMICAYLGIPHSRYMRDERLAGKFRLSNRRPRKFGKAKG